MSDLLLLGLGLVVVSWCRGSVDSVVVLRVSSFVVRMEFGGLRMVAVVVAPLAACQTRPVLHLLRGVERRPAPPRVSSLHDEYYRRRRRIIVVVSPCS